MPTRRHLLLSALSAPAFLRFGMGAAQATTTLKIAHQFPGGSIDQGDFRDRLVRRFAAEIAQRSGGELRADIYPDASLVPATGQFAAMRTGKLDLSLVPLSYAGEKWPETNLGLMPGLVSTYDQGLRWKNSPVGEVLTNYLADNDIVLLSWIWQAGGVASRLRPLILPEDVKGLSIRGGSRQMNMVLRTAGATALSMPSNEILAAMQSGACDAGITSSTSLISFKLQDVARYLSSGAGTSYWFMLEPLMMSKTVFDRLPTAHQDILRAVGAEMEAFGKAGAQHDDLEVARIYQQAGAQVSALDAAAVGQWRDLARDTAWKDFSAKTPLSAQLLKLAGDVAA
jgi:TRAP-type C4-dicarboxylate transport system substrate-binding protein